MHLLPFVALPPFSLQSTRYAVLSPFTVCAVLSPEALCPYASERRKSVSRTRACAQAAANGLRPTRSSGKRATYSIASYSLHTFAEQGWGTEREGRALWLPTHLTALCVLSTPLHLHTTILCHR